jgi:hypothetical protein
MKSKILGLPAVGLLACAITMPASAAYITYQASLSGPNEEPPNASPGTGMATVTVDNVANIMMLDVTFSRLIGATTAAHIHCCKPLPGTGNVGVATTTLTFPGFQLGVSAGTYSATFDMTLGRSFNPSFVTGNRGTPASAWAVLLAGFDAGKTYFNIHPSGFPGGEIRGLLQRTAAPEPGTLALLGFGLAGLGFTRQRELV